MSHAKYRIEGRLDGSLWRHLSSLLSVLVLISCGHSPHGTLLIAFPVSATEIRLVFSDTVERESASRAASYVAGSGLKILSASVDSIDPRRVTLTTSPMQTWMSAPPTRMFETPLDLPLTVDEIRATGVDTKKGSSLANAVSPRFVEAIPSAYQIQKPRDNRYPFESRLAKLTATHQYNNDGGTGGNQMIDLLGFTFLHRPTGGPFNSLKVVTNKHVPGLEQVRAKLPAGLGPHVQFAGGQVETVDGETRLVDTGFMEGSVVEPPLSSPPPYPISLAEISPDSSHTLRAKSLQGVIVLVKNVTIDSVSAVDNSKLRHITFHDLSGVRVHGLVFPTVTLLARPLQHFSTVRGIVHQPRAGEYEVIIEMDKHLTP